MSKNASENKSENKVKARPPFLRALGRDEPPEQVTVQGRTYCRAVIYKHDSWAATCRYEAVTPAGEHDSIIVKINRRQPVFFIPMKWVGRLFARREAAIYQRVKDLAGELPGELPEGVPAFLGRLDATTVSHVFVPGEPLAPGDELSAEFMQQLRDLVAAFHERDIAIVDLQKCENILKGDDGRPYLMDFQISWMLPQNAVGKFPPLRWVHRIFVNSDDYHVLKHYYRFRRDLMTDAELRRIEHKPWPIRLHRAVVRYPQKLRRQLLVWLKIREPGGKATSELNPERGVERRREGQ